MENLQMLHSQTSLNFGHESGQKQIEDFNSRIHIQIGIILWEYWEVSIDLLGSHFELVSNFLQDELDRQIIEHVFYNSLLWFIDSIIQSQVIHQVDHVFNRCFF